LSGESLAWVLDAGSHVIDIDHSTMGQTCGILPVGIDSAKVLTRGLKWNLGKQIPLMLSDSADWSTSFEGDVSTSNHLLPEEPVVFLSTDRPVLWCVEVRGGTV
jgi:thiamine pyrophosphokinase